MEILDRLEIIDNSSEGIGIAKSDGVTVFVENSLIGDVVKARIIEKKKKFWTAEIVERIESSLFREENFSDDFSHIFPYINLNYEKEVELKKQTIINTFKKNANIEIENLEFIENSHIINYRNKIELKINEKNELCYYSDSGNTKIRVEKCPLTDDCLNNIFKELENLIKKYKITAYDYKSNSGILKNISIRSSYKGEIIIIFIITKETVELKKLFEELKNIKNIIGIYLNINDKKNSAIMLNETKEIYKTCDFIDKIGEYSFKISPKSFFQVNKYQTEKLYNVAKEFLGKITDETLLDLYCGIGTTSIYFAENFKQVIGVEVVKDAVKDAKENAVINGVENTKFIYGKSEDVIEKILKENKVDVVSVDPPRKGLDKKVIETITNAGIKKIVYISCNSATMSRDVKIFTDNGYAMKKIVGVDMFSRTGHVECVCLLSNV